MSTHWGVIVLLKCAFICSSGLSSDYNVPVYLVQFFPQRLLGLGLRVGAGGPCAPQNGGLSTRARGGEVQDLPGAPAEAAHLLQAAAETGHQGPRARHSASRWLDCTIATKGRACGPQREWCGPEHRCGAQRRGAARTQTSKRGARSDSWFLSPLAIVHRFRTLKKVQDKIREDANLGLLPSVMRPNKYSSRKASQYQEEEIHFRNC